MKNMFSFVMGVLVIVLIAGAGYFYFGNSPVQEQDLNINSEPQETGTPQNTEGVTAEVPSTETNTPTETSPTTETKGSKTFTITYTDSGFNPNTLEASIGDSVTFLKQGVKAMWVASNPHPIHSDFSSFDEKKTGDSYTFTFTQAGTFKYHNHVSSRDGGVVTVK